MAEVVAPLELAALLKRPKVWPMTEVAIPKLGGSVRIRAISAGERDRIEALTQFAQEHPNAIRGRFRAEFCAYFLADKDGNRLVDDDHIEALDAMEHEVIDQIYDAGLRFNQLRGVSELEKN